MSQNEKNHEEIAWNREADIWLKFYMNFNDDNRHHAENAFASNGLEDTSVETLVSENRAWYKEILSHGITETELLQVMPEAAEYRP